MHNQFNGRSIGGVVNELKDELKDFLQTRYQMLVSELREKTSALRIAAPLLVAALIFALGGWTAGKLVARTIGVVWSRCFADLAIRGNSPTAAHADDVRIDLAAAPFAIGAFSRADANGALS